jgi:ribosomal protein S18 acetylase RimI-like enzyme
MDLDHSYRSDYVWQMDIQEDGDLTRVAFRNVRLPRTSKVNYPREIQALADTWTHRSAFLVATQNDFIVGYIGLVDGLTPMSTWVTDLAVDPMWRQRGIGSALVVSGLEWARRQNNRRLVLEMQPKNHPAIALADKLGFVFTGYMDRYYPNHDIGLFFSKWIR